MPASELAIQLNRERNSNHSPEQWQAWLDSGNYNPQTGKFRTINMDANGQPITGFEGDSPDDCPPGTTKYGDQQCLPLDHPRVAGQAQQTQQPAAAQYTPPKPVFEGQAGSLTYTGNPLTDALLYQFNNQKSLQTGESGLFGNFGAQGTDKPSITGKLLQGGGLIWGEGASPFGGVTPPAPQGNGVLPGQGLRPAPEFEPPPMEQPVAAPPIAQPFPTFPPPGGEDNGSPLSQALSGVSSSNSFNDPNNPLRLGGLGGLKGGLMRRYGV